MSVEDLCRQWHVTYKVDVGRSFGSLPELLWQPWTVLRCDQHVRQAQPVPAPAAYVAPPQMFSSDEGGLGS